MRLSVSSMLLAACLLAATLLVAGCSPRTAPSTSSGASGASPSAAAGALGTPSPTVGAAAAPAGAGGAVSLEVSRPAATPRALFLQVDSPFEDTSVNAATLDVTGSTIPSAVVSVNGDLVDVGRDGHFATRMQLAPGPNVVEVVASDTQGNEQSVIRSVIYEP